jgi:hypothetical protein
VVCVIVAICQCEVSVRAPTRAHVVVRKEQWQVRKEQQLRSNAGEVLQTYGGRQKEINRQAKAA